LDSFGNSRDTHTKSSVTAPLVLGFSSLCAWIVSLPSSSPFHLHFILSLCSELRSFSCLLHFPALHFHFSLSHELYLFAEIL
jgi:hypothetical protein